MSAISGIFNRNGHSVDFDQIKKMNGCVSHRGPDGEGLWAERSVALGHQMMHTTSESINEKLPKKCSSGDFVITSDARIDNRDELSLLLNIKNSNVPDSIFILKAYQKWGEKCVEHLVGDFVFAIWNKKDETFFCARDHMGVKPFYYYIDSDYFTFATEIKSLLSLKQLNIEINEIRIADYLMSNFDDKEITFFNNIKRLPPATSITVGVDNVNYKKYWTLDYNRELVLDSDKEYIEQFLKIFKESVNCRLRSFSAPGFFLSGGLDSSSITCTAQQILGSKVPKLKTFSFTFKQVPKSDETLFVKKLLSSGYYEPFFIRGDEIGPLNESEKFFWHFDGAFFAPNLFLHWNTYKKASENQVRVILDGMDGDTTVSHGEKVLAELASKGQWKKVIDETMAISKRLHQNPFKTFFYRVLVDIIPENWKKILRPLWATIIPSPKYEKIANKEFAEKILLNDRHHKFQTEKCISKNVDHRLYHYDRLNSGIIQFVLELSDVSAAAFSIEPRYPFYDKRLVEFCLALPSDQKINQGWDRFILRKAMEDILPPKIQWRKDKADLSYNFERNFYLFEKNTIEKAINHDVDVKKYVDMDYLKKVYNKYSLGNSYEIMGLWKAVTLSLWLKQVHKKI